VKPRGPMSRRTWRPELAYAIGLLVTDGNLSLDGRHITLVSRDVDQLKTFASILEINSRIGRHRGGYTPAGVFRLAFGDRLLFDWLAGIGLSPRKTHTIGALSIPDEFFRDFLRGHLDGDGTISSYVDRHNTRLKPQYVYQRLYVRFISASRPHIEWLQTKTRFLLGIAGHVTVQQAADQGRVPLYTLRFAKGEAIALLRWIYHGPDVPCLARKRAIVEPFLTGNIRDFRHPVGFGIREEPARWRWGTTTQCRSHRPGTFSSQPRLTVDRVNSRRSGWPSTNVT